MRPLAANVPAVSQWLFGDDFNKCIAQISNMNNALSQSFKSNNQQVRYNHSSVNRIIGKKLPNLPRSSTLEE